VLSSLPLRTIAFTSTNLVFATIGIVVMTCLRDWYWPAWNILGLTLSILVALVAILPVNWTGFTGTLRLALPTVEVSGSTEISKTVERMVSSVATLLPHIPLNTSLEVPVVLPRRALHHTLLLLAMVLTAGVFGAQITDAILADQDQDDSYSYFPSLTDPDNTYARWRTLVGLDLVTSKLVVLICSPVSFLLCLPLLLLTHRSTQLHLLLAAMLALAMAATHSFLSVDSLSWMLLLDATSLSPTSYVLRLAIALAQPLLAATFTALGLSFLQALGGKSAELSTKWKVCKTSLVTMAALTILVLAMVSLTETSTTLGTSLSTQWNSTEDHRYSRECSKDTRSYRYDYDYERSTTARPAKPSYCYDVSLDYRVEAAYNLTNLSLLSLSTSHLLLGLLLLLGPRLSPAILLVLGIAMFGSAITATISYAASLREYMDASNIAWIASPSVAVVFGLLGGIGLCIGGCSTFIALSSFILRLLLLAINLIGLILLTLVGLVTTVAMKATTVASTTKSNDKGSEKKIIEA
jgi:hypothetical protein